MAVTVLKDVLLAQDAIDRYYDGHVPVNLWRAKRKNNADIFALVEEPLMLSNGRPRPADIKIIDRDGVKWVSVEDRPRGVSTFDRPGVPPGKDWSYYSIPAGTALPEGLAVVRDEFNTRFNATHYTIAPARDMPLADFKLLLNELAKRAILREAV